MTKETLLQYSRTNVDIDMRLIKLTYPESRRKKKPVFQIQIKPKSREGWTTCYESNSEKLSSKEFQKRILIIKENKVQFK